jgi:hypothetical protein
MSEMEALRDALRGDHEPLSRIGVSVVIPWWRRRIQRYVAPRRFKLWVQRRILSDLDGGNE